MNAFEQLGKLQVKLHLVSLFSFPIALSLERDLDVAFGELDMWDLHIAAKEIFDLLKETDATDLSAEDGPKEICCWTDVQL